MHPLSAAALSHAIPHRFAQVADSAPDHIAVIDGRGSLTYAGLLHAAERVARGLVALRGMQAKPIALLMRPGRDLIAGIIGTMMAGKFYVPLEPSQPDARLQVVLQSSEAPLLSPAWRPSFASRSGPIPPSTAKPSAGFRGLAPLPCVRRRCCARASFCTGCPWWKLMRPRLGSFGVPTLVCVSLR